MNRSPLASAGRARKSPARSFARNLQPDAAVHMQDARDFMAKTPDGTDFSGFRSVKCYVSKRGRTRLRTGEWREFRCRETEHLRKTCGNGKDVRQSSYSYDELLACGRGELFGPGNAQLPLPPMLMFDRITEISEDGGEHGLGSVRAELDVKSDLWFFPCHFQGDPVMPGCLGLDALWQMTGFFLGWLGEPGRGRAISTGEIKFSKMVTPETRLVEYGVDIKKLRRGRLVLGIADGWLKADGETIYQAKDLRVGLFRTE